MYRFSFLLLLFIHFNSFCHAYSDDLAIVQAVYSKIKLAKGQKNINLPEIVIEDRFLNIAAYNRRTNRLVIEEKAIETCRSFGVNMETALAFIIGHELTHFYQNHEGAFAFFMDSSNLKANTQEERDADIYGAMLAYFAGYKNVTQLMPQLIDHLYEAYELNTKTLPQYPAKEERKRLAEAVVMQTQMLIDLYEGAKYLAVIGQDNLAGDIYQHIGKFVETKELLNNEAFAYLSAASEIQEYGKINWAYPLNVDLNNPLRFPSDVEKIILIKKAKEKLAQALEYDSNYFPALLNYAIALSLEEAISKSKSKLVSAKQSAKNENQLLSVKLLEAILLAQAGQINQSKELLTSIEQSRFQEVAKLASFNLSILNEQIVEPNFLGTKLNRQSEVINGINLGTIPQINFDSEVALSKDPFNPKTLKIKRFNQSTLLLFTNSNQSLALHLTTKTNTKDIGIGAAAQQIDKNYAGQNLKILTHDNGGSFRHYPNSSIVFLLNQSNRLMEWANYAIY